MLKDKKVSVATTSGQFTGTILNEADKEACLILQLNYESGHRLREQSGTIRVIPWSTVEEPFSI